MTWSFNSGLNAVGANPNKVNLLGQRVNYLTGMKSKSRNHQLSVSKADLPKVLAVSYSYPPETEPRAIQVSRLLRHLEVSTVLVCAESSSQSEGIKIDGLGDSESFLQAILRVPFSPAKWRRLMNGAARRVYIPVWSRTPDPLVPWKRPVLTTVENYIRSTGYRPNVLMTFAFPLIDSLIGLELKRRHNFPWLAHFSDPWVDSPFKVFDPLSRALNVRLERQVIENADRVVFTSEETADLVMAKYDASLRAKVDVVPHAYEAQLFRQCQNVDDDRMTIRFLGDLYLSRTPKPLFDALRILSSSDAETLSKFRFEIIGSVHDREPHETDLHDLPSNLVVFRPRVSYLESLELMSSANGLMVIDAPAEQNKKSVFLPSKLIEYVGGGRPIIGLTPPGAAANLIERLGGWVADPGNTDDIARTLRHFLSFLNKQNERSGTWGEAAVRREYQAPAVAAKFKEIILELSGH